MTNIECEYCDFIANDHDVWMHHQQRMHNKYSQWIAPSKVSVSVKEKIIYLEGMMDALGFFMAQPSFDLWEVIQSKFDELRNELLGDTDKNHE